MNDYNFNPSLPIEEADQTDTLFRILYTGSEEEQKIFTPMLKKRLEEIAKTADAKTTSAEDRYLTIALQGDDSDLKQAAKEVACKQLSNFIRHEIEKFHVSSSEKEDMMQDAFVNVLMALPSYNGKQKLSTFCRLHIKDALVRHIGSVDYASNKKWRLWLLGAISAAITSLRMQDIARPTYAQIAAEINSHDLYRPVTEKNIEEAMGMKKTVVSLDDTSSSDDADNRSRHETVKGHSPSPEDFVTQEAGDEAVKKNLDEVISSMDAVMQYIWKIRLNSFKEKGKDASQEAMIREIRVLCPNLTKVFIKSAINQFNVTTRQKFLQAVQDSGQGEYPMEKILEILSEM